MQRPALMLVVSLHNNATILGLGVVRHPLLS